MARFKGTVRGSRGEASRLGGVDSGLLVKANGWDVGVSIHARVNDAGHDVFHIEVNGGSHRGLEPRRIATVGGGIVTLENGEKRHLITVESEMAKGHRVAQDGRWED